LFPIFEPFNCYQKWSRREAALHHNTVKVVKKSGRKLTTAYEAEYGASFERWQCAEQEPKAVPETDTII